MLAGQQQVSTGAPPKGTSYGVAAHPNWGPAKAQRSGFGGERRSKEVNGAFRPKGGNEVHGLCDDEAENQWKRTRPMDTE